MRKPPEWTEFPKYPVIAGTIILAAAATAAWWLKFDISRLLADPHVRRGELWRLLTDVLPHKDVIHFAFNVMWLWTLGTIVEDAFGHLVTFLMLLFFAACSSAAEYAILDGGVGLSGVGYGIFGLLWILSRRDPRFVDAMDQRIVNLFIGWFFVCIALTVTKILPVGNIAHGVGAAAGAILGYCMTLRRYRRSAVIGWGVTLLAFSIAGATIGRSAVNLSSYAGAEEAGLGYAALERNDNTEAADWFEEATRLAPREPTSWYDLGIAYHRLGRDPEALAAYKRAHEINPDDRDFRQAYEELAGNESGSKRPGFLSTLLSQLSKRKPATAQQ